MSDLTRERKENRLTNLEHIPSRIGLLPALPKRRRVDLRQSPIPDHKPDVPLYLLPYAIVLLEIHPRLPQSHEIEVTHHLGLDRLQQRHLRIKVAVQQLRHLLVLRRAGEGCDGAVKRWPVKVDGDLVDVVEGADQVVDLRVVGVEEGEQVGEVEGGDEVGFEADGEGDGRRVERAKGVGGGEVGGEDRRKRGRSEIGL